uniref:Transcription factor WRKY15 n=1 Tax=Lilium regale TaxID=82328 RepID=A0A894TFY5_LILRE|nr:transcription factor WRKY15 [Lilium regale]
MSENPAGTGEPGGGAPEDAPPPPELRFEGFGGAPGRADPRVSSLAGGARYKAMSPARLPITRSPCVTIPPGFSPSALLESPVLLTNIKAEPSPTTGTFSMPSVTNNSNTLSSPRDASNYNAFDNGIHGDFEFKPHVWPAMSSGFSSLRPLGCVSSNSQENVPYSQMQSQTSQSINGVEDTVHSSHALSLSVPASNPPVETSILEANEPAEVAMDEAQPSMGFENGTQAALPDTNGSASLSVVEKSSDDGYNWRKYGQKHVKGSEFPRSYYKCTHPNCQMKKHLERSLDGQITEIIYKGRHDHPKPQPSRRMGVGAIMFGQGEERSDDFPPLSNSTDKPSNAHGQTSHHVDPNGTQELSPVSISDDEQEVGGGQSNHIGDVGGDDDDDDPESKRRKKEAITIDATPLGKPNREPRVVVQTISEVDILDDGYRWRKYGQKVVKGNPNPRSYYKCTNAGCPVRKHVERASNDPKAVITTYEGKHNHDVPVARNINHDTSTHLFKDGGGNALNSRMSLALSNMLRTCDPVGTSNPYAQPDESDRISLDLGVGVGLNEHQQAQQDRGQVHNHQMQFSDYNNMVMQAIPRNSVYGGSANGMYGPGEDKGEGFSFNPQPINHSENLYYSNAGNMVMGP